ncbi:hypothetical protein CKM354_000569800 [Cercospora kikuchii]|uniref:Uncharacterized protein n=1 Tax=Cercospora kikuchii TaxID=84275 RepID=A0A9P3CI33_9PEZI|nr:uncharacterized protein CKM354_000569800 [Cercospora kikuchii]GIZ42426.1 hypothetical protein CKM354_000569800 [Cercospora kikuchii]
MADTQQPSRQSKTADFMRGAGTVNDPENKLWGPARWVVQLVQYLIAIIMITIAEGFKSIVSGGSSRRRREKPRTE